MILRFLSPGETYGCYLKIDLGGRGDRLKFLKSGQSLQSYTRRHYQLCIRWRSLEQLHLLTYCCQRANGALEKALDSSQVQVTGNI